MSAIWGPESILFQIMSTCLSALFQFSSAIGFPNYGVAIIILTILIKTLLFPLTYKQMSSMRRMVDLQPQMKAIQEKYKNNKEKANAAIMKLYKDNNVNPLGGCLPLLVQLPIFIALYQTLFHYPFHEYPESVYTFLTFDLTVSYGFALSYHLILPILAAATTYLQTKAINPNSTDPTQKILLYAMPVFIAYISATVPSGLALYWITMNIVSIFQQLFINYSIKKANAAA